MNTKEKEKTDQLLLRKPRRGQQKKKGGGSRRGKGKGTEKNEIRAAGLPLCKGKKEGLACHWGRKFNERRKRRLLSNARGFGGVHR